MYSKIKSVIPSILVAVFITLATLFGLEIILRIVADRLPMSVLLYLHQDLKTALPSVQQQVDEYSPWTYGLVEDPSLGWRHKPNMTREGINEDGEAYSLKASPEGFFTPDQPDRDVNQLIVMGDSFLSTFFVPKPIAWVLSEELDLPVYNLSVGGWGPESYRAAYNEFGKGRKSKIVVVFTFVNDIVDVDNWNQWKASEQKISFNSWLLESSESIVNKENSWLDQHSVLWNVTKFVVRKARYNRFDLTVGLIGQYFQGPTEGTEFRLRLTRGYPFMTMEQEDFLAGGLYWPYMEAYFQSLDRLREDIEEQGNEMLLVWIPSKERVYLPLLAEDLPRKYRKYVTNSSGEIDALEYALHRYAEDRNIDFLDLTPELMRRARAGEKLYFTLDGHLNTLGNQVVGELAASAIRDLLEDMEQQ